MKYKYLFGPVPSRRLGVSLGVDLVPQKTCNFDCIYCECGRTTVFTNERDSFVDSEEIINEIKIFLATGIYLDYITFSGWGEPTLNRDLGKIIAEIKKITNISIAVITNGALLYDKNVVDDLLQADMIMPNLDSATEEGFYKINRPVEELKVDKVIQGLIDFRNIYNGTMNLEIFIVEGINDSDKEIEALKEAVFKIRPDKVQLNSLDRPPTEGWVKKADFDKMEYIKDKLGYTKTEIITKYRSRDSIKDYTPLSEELITNMIKKRPCTINDIVGITGLSASEINKYLDILEREGKIKAEPGERGIFVRSI